MERLWDILSTHGERGDPFVIDKKIKTMINFKILMLQLFKKSNNLDGSIIHRVEVIKNLSRLGNEVHAIVIGDLDLGGKVVTYKVNYKNKYFIFIAYLIQLSKLLFIEKFDVVYARHPVFGVIGIIFKKIRKSKLVYEINGIREDEQKLIRNNLKHTRKTDKIKLHIRNIINFLFIRGDRYIPKRADAIRAVTPNIKTYLHNAYGVSHKKIYVIGNGANTELFTPREKKKSIRALKLNESNCYVCFVGLLAPWQGVEYLIQSSPLILKEFQNTKFLIIGNGQMKKELINLAEKTGVYDKFIFTRAVPYEEVPKYINASDVCVAPFVRARNERIGLSPLKIYEYLACGKPVVSSRIPNLEFIEKQNVGTLVEPENSEDLAEAIIKLLKDEKLREEMGRNGREYVVKNHSWENVAKKIAKVCEEVMR